MSPTDFFCAALTSLSPAQLSLSIVSSSSRDAILFTSMVLQNTSGISK
eukprot:CAMPEP_0197498106 /NCGR_PEP_ID=MMETSP1311-20131121/55609_1 /TAXON_ID=464262 /ORGANISM="Genus nov. species nov., Strain RCC856" /LENGTH=47 /DNA_ID= /DNA_START= /DNA_END= /DNA_ORIENTATION=